MSQKKNGKKGEEKKKAPVHVRHYELSSGGACHEERKIRNLLGSKDVAGVAEWALSAPELGVIVRKIAGEGSALSLFASACLLFGEFVYAIREVLACFNGKEGDTERFLDRLTDMNDGTEKFTVAVVRMFGDADVSALNAGMAEQLILGRFAIPTEEPMTSNRVAFHAALGYLVSDPRVGARAKHLGAMFSIPERMRTYRKMLAAGEQGVINLGVRMCREDIYDIAALEQ
ncbi:MAG: hypothetical protein HY536_01040, partial [Candidatus Colwellbacteria bacterium]|nr:hypothetical protein [Candidatus Colwellbacteria bacterium]